MENILLSQTQRDDKFPNSLETDRLLELQFLALKEYLNKHWGFSTICRHKFYIGPQTIDTQTFLVHGSFMATVGCL